MAEVLKVKVSSHDVNNNVAVDAVFASSYCIEEVPVK